MYFYRPNFVSTLHHIIILVSVLRDLLVAWMSNIVIDEKFTLIDKNVDYEINGY